MLNIKTMKKQISYVLVCVMLAVMVMPLLSVEVSAVTTDGGFEMGGDGLIAGTDYDLAIDLTSGERTLTVLSNNVRWVDYPANSGDIGHVIVGDGVANVEINSISTNGDVTIKNGVTAGDRFGGSNIHARNITVDGTTYGDLRASGNVVVNDTGVVNSGTTLAEGTVNVYGNGKVDAVELKADATIDGTNLTAVHATGGTSNIPLANITGIFITIHGNMTLSHPSGGQIDLQKNLIIYPASGSTDNVININNDVITSGGGEINVNGAGTRTLNIQSPKTYTGELVVAPSGGTVTINGNIIGDIRVHSSNNSAIKYESGTLHGNVTKSGSSTNTTLEIGAATIVTGNVDVDGGITVNGMVGGSATATGGSLTVNPTGMVNANSIGITIAGVAVMPNVYYPITTANTVDAPQSTAPASGYIRITTDGAKNIVELNNIDVHLVSETLDATSSTLPLEIYAVGMNVLSLLNHDLPITMTAASGGEFVSQIHTTDTFTMQSGTLKFYAGNWISRQGITASAIVINGGQMSGEGAFSILSVLSEPALSIKPTINPPAGMMARIMVVQDMKSGNTPVEVAESTDYHLNNYVQISFVADPNANTNTGTTTTTTTYNPAISPQTGVY